MADLSNYQTFLYSTVAIPVSALPTTSQIIVDSFNFATALVLDELRQVPQLYDLAVYNGATSYLLNWAQDVPNQSFFQSIRQKFKINDFQPGIISAASDESTSTNYTNPDWAKTLSFSDLQFMKDPYGRQFLSLLQRYGTLWGRS